MMQSCTTILTTDLWTGVSLSERYVSRTTSKRHPTLNPLPRSQEARRNNQKRNRSFRQSVSSAISRVGTNGNFRISEHDLPPQTATLPFILSPDQIESCCRELGFTRTQYLTSLLPRLSNMARAPISNFHVAAIGLGGSGKAYVGVNLEIVGLPLNNSVHAEQFVVANAMQHGETMLQQMLVSHAPCGHCRQFLQELRNSEAITVVIADRHAESGDLHHFLPHRFGPHDLLEADFPLLLESRHNGLRLSSSDLPGTPRLAPYPHPHFLLGPDSSAVLTHESHNGSWREASSPADSASTELAIAALAAANAAYAPYSRSPSGVALRLRTGEVYRGSYMESAAYNPSLPPLQAALVALVSQQSGADFSEIAEVALVEAEGVVVQFAEATLSAVRKLSPGARFTAYLAST